MTGYKIDYNTDAKGRGNDLSKATQTYPTPTREDLGAALKSNTNIQYFNDITNISSNARTTVEFDGFFFAPEYDEYREYGERTIHAFLNIRKHASQEDYNIDAQYNDAGRKEHIRLQENGYDRVIHQVEVYYCPVNIDGTQFSARLLVKRYENNGRVIEHLQLYDLSAKQKKSDAENSQMGQPALTSTIASDLRYKVKDLIHTSQVQDKELLGITSDTLYRSDDIAFSIGSFVFQFCRKCF